MSGSAKVDFDTAPRAATVGAEDDLLIRQGNQVAKAAASLLVGGLGGSGISGTLEGANGEIIIFTNGVITSFTP